MRWLELFTGAFIVGGVFVGMLALMVLMRLVIVARFPIERDDDEGEGGKA